jgi:type IV fimbrial biogenesis protein FimT
MTLLELLTVLAVIAVLLAIAVPSFVSLTQTNRVAGEVNALSGALQFARAEAIKEGVPVTICASSNGTSCLGASTSAWNTGWIVFSDTNGNKAVDAGDLILRKQIPWTSTDTFTTANVGAVTYSRDGFAIGLAGAVTWTLHTSPLNTSATRCVYLNIAGHQQVMTNGQAVGTGTCS